MPAPLTGQNNRSRNSNKRRRNLIYLTSNLSWDYQLDSAINKGNQKLAHLRRKILFPTLKKVKSNLVKRYVLLVLFNGSNIWVASKTRLKRMEKLQSWRQKDVLQIISAMNHILRVCKHRTWRSYFTNYDFASQAKFKAELQFFNEGVGIKVPIPTLSVRMVTFQRLIR